MTHYATTQFLAAIGSAALFLGVVGFLVSRVDILIQRRAAHRAMTQLDRWRPLAPSVTQHRRIWPAVIASVLIVYIAASLAFAATVGVRCGAELPVEIGDGW